MAPHAQRYVRANETTHSDPDFEDPSLVLDQAAEAACRAAGAETHAEREALWARIARRPDAPAIALAAGATAALEAGDPQAADARATRALTYWQDDLHLQSLQSRARGVSLPAPELRERFCRAPFQNVETAPGGNVYMCCPAWLPKPIGNLDTASAAEVWNSPAAQDIRASIHDGSYRYCSRVHCPKISDGSLESKSAIAHEALQRISDTRETRMERGPAKVVLSHDRSCNLSCPSCRTELIVARKSEQEWLNALVERNVFPMLKQAERVRITSSGDAFGSAHFQYVLRNLATVGNDALRLDLQTNGLLLTPVLWERLKLEGRVDQLIVSVDAARPETYAIVRRGGNFRTLLKALEFMAGLRREKRIGGLRLDFVVQALNFREMPEFVTLARRFAADGVKFQMIRSWGTYSADEFACHDISRPDHPDYTAFLETLTAPELASPFVELWGMSESIKAAKRLGDRGPT